MEGPMLPRLIEADSKRDKITIVPLKVVGIDFFGQDMRDLVEEFDLLESYIGPGRSINYEAARNEGGGMMKDLRFHKYWVSFCNEAASQRFFNLLNTKSHSFYRAEIPEGPLGIDALQLLRQIS